MLLCLNIGTLLLMKSGMCRNSHRRRGFGTIENSFNCSGTSGSTLKKSGTNGSGTKQIPGISSFTILLASPAIGQKPCRTMSGFILS